MTDVNYRRLGVLIILVSAVASCSVCYATGKWLCGKANAIIAKHYCQIEDVNEK